MLKHARHSSVLAVLAVLMGGFVTLAGALQGQAASVLLATAPPPVPGAAAVNQTLASLNAGGKNLIAGVSLIAKFEVSGTHLVAESGRAQSFQFAIPATREIRSGSVTYKGNDEILYFTLKAGRDTRLFGFFDARGNQIALNPGEALRFTSEKGLSSTSFFGRTRPIPEPASVLLLLFGGALVARAVRRQRAPHTA